MMVERDCECMVAPELSAKAGGSAWWSELVVGMDVATAPKQGTVVGKWAWPHPSAQEADSVRCVSLVQANWVH